MMSLTGVLFHHIGAGGASVLSESQARAHWGGAFFPALTCFSYRRKNFRLLSHRAPFPWRVRAVRSALFPWHAIGLWFHRLGSNWKALLFLEVRSQGQGLLSLEVSTAPRPPIPSQAPLICAYWALGRNTCAFVHGCHPLTNVWEGTMLSRSQHTGNTHP